jgi:hypothetical protein
VTLFLATSNSPAIRDAIRSGAIGRLCTPQGGSPPIEGTWGADSGCYTLGERFSLDKYLLWLDRMAPYRERCLFAPAPDVVGDHAATLIRSMPVLPEIRKRGYPAALVLQDGCTPDRIPWLSVDVLFVGGTTDYKLGPDAAACIAEASKRGVPVHMGRVNSRKRFQLARQLGCASVDGTYLSYGPSVNLPRLLRWSE